MPKFSHSDFIRHSGFVIPRSGYPSTFFRTISVTIFGFAFPWLAFIACPVNQFMAFSLPA